MEAKAVQILRDVLESAEGKAQIITSLSVKVKWGQCELGGLGHIRRFLMKYPEVFNLDGTTVTLLQSGGDTAPKTTSKSAPKAPPDSLHSTNTEDDAKPASKSAAAPKPIPKNAGHVADEADLRRKRRWSDDGNGSAVAPDASPEKSARQSNDRVSSSGAAGPPADGSYLRQDPYQMAKGSSPAVPEPPRPPVASANFGAFAGSPAPKQSGLVPPPAPEHVTGMPQAPPPPPIPSSNTGAAAAPFLPPDLPPPPRPPGAPPVAPWNVQQPAAPPPPLPPPVHPAPPSRHWENDTLSDDELRQSIIRAKIQGIELELQAIAQKLIPQDDYKQDIETALKVLKGVAVQALGPIVNSQESPQLDIIGSSLQGTDVHGSDVDIALRLGPSNQPIEERDARVQKVREKLQGRPYSTVFDTCEAMRFFPHASCEISAKLRGAAGALPKLVVHLVLQPREDESQARPESLDHAVSRLCDSFEPTRSLVRLVKLWTVIQGFSAAHDGYMNGMAWTAFVLCFLQRQKHIKALSNLSMAASAASGEEQLPSLTALLRGFFQFVCAPQPRTPWGLSLNEGRDCPAAPPPECHVGPPPPLYLEDPCAWKRGLRRNLASTLGEAQWSRILEEARRAADKLDDTKPMRWFHWAEIFDPQSLTPSANPAKRLPKLSEAAAAVVPSQGQQPAPETKGPAPAGPLTPGAVPPAAPVKAPAAPPPVAGW
eukprot:TRINITY_DN31474_c0_g1_i1.p1 TRINITY_DN31474_c0_g1~~TRINITY_DN31474_c0_g1_i1.p1  ORF type:complete len:721 (-),score=135.25 TRINITY_DN31474_c0_g1_i1:67-2199(-)